MVDNRYATALVIGSVLSLLATVYLSVAAGTQHWYQYTSQGNHELSNASKLKEDFITGDFNEKTYVEAMFHLNGTQGLWWRCILLPGLSFCANYVLLFDLYIMILTVCICGFRSENEVCELHSPAAV